MIYLKINEEDFENKYAKVENFIDNLLGYIAKHKDLVVISKNTLDFQVLNLYKEIPKTDKFISRDSSSVILNGLKVAYDETLETINKINTYFKNELDIKIEKYIEDEDVTTFKFISNIPVHYINAEFNSTEDILKDFESLEDENNCVIINLFSEEDNTTLEGHDNVKIVNIPKDFKGKARKPHGSIEISVSEPEDTLWIDNEAAFKPERGTNSSKLTLESKLDEVFSKNSEKPKNENT